MVERVIYRRAPINEAVIDIHVAPPTGLRFEDLAAFQDEERDTYPTRQNRMKATSRVSLGGRVEAQVQQEQVGYVFSSADERQVVQTRVDGFTFSRLSPYDRWETFSAEAFRLWEGYLKLAKPLAATRLAVRFVNRIAVPMPVDSLSDYLLTYPEVSAKIPYSAISNFVFRLELPQDDFAGTAIINEAIIPIESDDEIGLLLDIDVFQEGLALDPHSEALKESFADLHDREHEIFESCITDKTREVIS